MFPLSVACYRLWYKGCLLHKSKKIQQKNKILNFGVLCLRLSKIKAKVGQGTLEADQNKENHFHRPTQSAQKRSFQPARQMCSAKTSQHSVLLTSNLCCPLHPLFRGQKGVRIPENGSHLSFFSFRGSGWAMGVLDNHFRRFLTQGCRRLDQLGRPTGRDWTTANARVSCSKHSRN